MRRWLVGGIIGAGIWCRWVNFPGDIYFGYDQARDAFRSQSVDRGNMVLLGPPASVPGLFHGGEFYYWFAPWYFLGQGQPEGAATAVRIINLLGLIPTYLIGRKLGGRRTGVTAAGIYALSLEQSQMSRLLGHPGLAILPVLIFYWGWMRAIWNKDIRGLYWAAGGWGWAIQFHLSLAILTVGGVILSLIFKKELPKLKLKNWLIIAALGFSGVGSYLGGEIKFGFPLGKYILARLMAGPGGLYLNSRNLILVGQRFVADNLGGAEMTIMWGLALTAGIISLLIQKRFRKQGIFLGIWIITGLLPYAMDRSNLPTYYYGIGGSVGIILLAASLINQIPGKKWIGAAGVIGLGLLTNIPRIMSSSREGTRVEINSQGGMLWKDEQEVVDKMYQSAEGRPFAVNALSIPYRVNTTWSYVLENYGLPKYGYLPVWGGEAAPGYEGKLKIVTSRSLLPRDKFLILEPDRGLDQAVKYKFIEEENYFSRVIWRQYIGKIGLEYRE